VLDSVPARHTLFAGLCQFFLPFPIFWAQLAAKRFFCAKSKMVDNGGHLNLKRMSVVPTLQQFLTIDANLEPPLVFVGQYL
jgi:hypothetical protein